MEKAQAVDYKRERKAREYEAKKLKADLERNLPTLIKNQEWTNYLLGIIAMFLAGLFVLLMMGGLAP